MNASGDTLVNIVDDVQSVTEIVAQISNASHEQSMGIRDVNRAVMQIDTLTQQNAVLVRNAADGSRALSSQADNLSELVEFFTLNSLEPILGSHAPKALANAG